MMLGNDCTDINFIKKLKTRRLEALASYSTGYKVRFCKYCGEPLGFGTDSYVNGFHIHSCL